MLASLLASCLQAAPPSPNAALTHGPFVTQVEERGLWAWARVDRTGPVELQLLDAAGQVAGRALASAEANADLTLRWQVTDLPAATALRWRVVQGDVTLAAAERPMWRTLDSAAKQTRLVIGSCADERRFPAHPIWTTITTLAPEAVVLLGDTPYIDSTQLAVQRRRYREFYADPGVRAALAGAAFYDIWDDHDFGHNDTFGDVVGREHAMRAFREYHAGQLGADGEGVYHRFRRGPLEVFLLDTRWFGDMEPSPAGGELKSLLGKRQLEWLRQGLAASAAPFKVLASSTVWNGAVRPHKVDHWGHWPHERDALFAWLGTAHIGGVVLVSGDIHRTRAIVHPTRALAGYDLPELITSPLAQTPIAAGAVPTPGLLFDAGIPHTFLQLDARIDGDTAELTARLCDGEGKVLFTLTRTAAQLR